jgi:hypothetical protein
MDTVNERIEKWRIDDNTDEILDLSNLGLEELPILPSKLFKLNCSSNNLTVIRELPEALKYLNCNRNQIYIIEEFPLNCRFIDCSYNRLKSLPDLPVDCTYLNISHNLFNQLPRLPDTIEYLNYFNNNISDKVYDDIILMPNIKNVNGAKITFVETPVENNYPEVPSPKIKLSKCIYKNSTLDIEDYLNKSRDNIVVGTDTFYNCCKRSVISNVMNKTRFMKIEYNLIPCANVWISNNDLRKLLNKHYVIFRIIHSDIQIDGKNVGYVIPYT